MKYFIMEDSIRTKSMFLSELQIYIVFNSL